MTRPTHITAICSAMPIGDGGDAPEWVHLLPAGTIGTGDTRGPYSVTSMQAVIAASLKAGDKLPIDVNHSTDLAAPRGGDAPARGWIVALQERADGMWGKVEWTEEGRRLVAGKAYRGISPVIRHTKAKEVRAVLRASLTNTPNLTGLTALHSEETGMDYKARLLELLGLGSDAHDEAITAAVTAKLEAGDGEGGDGEGGKALQSLLTDPRYVALQSELAEATGKLNATAESLTALHSQIAQDKAEAFVDAAIREGRIGLNQSVRGDYIDMHMANPAQAEKLIGAMHKMPGSMIAAGIPDGADPAMSDPVLLAQEAGSYQKRLADAGQTIDFASAVMAVSEGRHK